ncbi:type III pantothenate kinase [Helicobacter suis]|uniref:type III pantothenate kinase n=1 Tax=Helicobacter suis TaxID=104628 RepID=UPI0013D6E942|nr:type III pantothenate kinase [Helicobacter suis]
MILCDIGNTYLHFYNGSKVWKSRVEQLQTAFTETLYYISVNTTHTQALLKVCPHAQDLAPLLILKSKYEGLGIDRKAACLGLGNTSAVVIDAGSAISVDVMDCGVHLGGVLLPGLKAYHKAYSQISKALNYPINARINLDTLPQSTQEALSYGALKSILLLLKDLIRDQKAYFTGGDGKFLATFFTQGIYHELLVFKGMQSVISKI